MRLFIAVDLDAAARAALGAEQRRLAEAFGSAGRQSLRWVRPEHAHLTLVFLGEVDEARTPSIVGAVERRVAQPPFDVTFEGVGVFPPQGAPRVLWLGAAEGATAMVALQGEMAERVRACGIQPDEAPFHPHLTLARWRERRPADRARVLAAGRPGAVARVRVDHATLYQSRLSPGGPSYTPLARATLFV